VSRGPKTKNQDAPSILARLQAVVERDAADPRIAEYAELLYGQAVLAEGGQLPDPAAFSKRVADLMARGL
jgi:molecular chaperone HtpG